MKFRTIYIIAALTALAGCSNIDDPINEKEESDITTRLNDLSVFISGPTELRAGGEYTYTASTSSSNTVTFAFGKISNGTFEALPNSVRVTLSGAKTYRIVPLASPGDYVVRVTVKSGGWSGISDYKVSIWYETIIMGPIPPMYRYTGIWRASAYRETENPFKVEYEMYRILATYDRIDNCALRVFNNMPSEENPCYSYLTPVYRNNVKSYYRYEVKKDPEASSSTVVFYIFKTQRPGTVPVYQMASYYMMMDQPGIPMTKVYTNKYLSTNSYISEGIDNLGLIGYAYPI